VTPNDILTEIRQLITDEGSTRWTDAVLRSYMFEIETDIVDRHPEAQYHTYVAKISRPTLLAANTDSFTIGTRWRNALIHGVCWKVYAEDSDDVANLNLSMAHKKQYEEAIT